MKCLTGVVLAVLLTVTGCAGQPTNNDARPTSSANIVTPSPSGDVERGPIAIKPTAGTFMYLQRSSDEAYGCQDGMTLLVLNVNEENGKRTIATHEGVEFWLERSDGYYGMSYPAMPMEFRAAVINRNFGFEMPEATWHGNTSSGFDAILDLRDVANQLSSLWICLSPPTQ